MHNRDQNGGKTGKNNETWKKDNQVQATNDNTRLNANTKQQQKQPTKPDVNIFTVGMPRRARAKASTAIASFPDTLLLISSTATDMSISEHPPPNTVRVSLTVCDNTHKASWSDRSASSKMCCDAPETDKKLTTGTKLCTPYDATTTTKILKIDE
jgi:hypothetical protein